MVSLLMCVVRKATIGLLLFAFPWGTALALIDISPKVLEIEGDSLPVTVINTGDTVEFVEIKLYQLENPGEPPEQEQLIPLGLVKEPYLYAAPFKLSLGPRQQKRIQLTVLKQPEKEKVYRLSVLPQRQVNITGTNSNVMLVGLGYMGLIRQLPSNKTQTWQHRCNAAGLLLEATGTVRLEFNDLVLSGKAVDDFNVYPGTPRQIVGKVLSGKAQGKDFTLQCNG
ncbi:MAG: hypothetical protein WAU54_19580 [Chania sp.]